MPRFLKITPERTHIPALHNHSKLWNFQKKIVQLAEYFVVEDS